MEKTPTSSKESGIVILIVALFIASIGGIYALLAIDTMTIRVANQELRSRLEIICKDVADNTVIQRSAVLKYREWMNDMVVRGFPRYSEITSARLLIPTMPASGDFQFPGETETVDTSGTGSGYPEINTIQTFNDLIGAKCDLPGGVDCQFVGDVRPTNVEDQYPKTLWHNFSDAGAKVGCEIEAKVTGTVLDLLIDTKIVARSVWHRPPRAALPVFNPASPVDSSPGLSIIVSPEFSTFAHDPRFRFFGGPSGYSDAFRQAYDPLFEYDTKPNSNLKAFSAETDAHTIGGSTTAKAQAVSEARRWDDLGAGVNAVDAEYEDKFGPPFLTWNDPAGMLVSDREELLVACMNPAILMRNAFMSSIMELASRHGHLRHMTELLITNPAHEAEAFPNSPVKVISFGDDIAEKRYQLPYLFYDSADKQGPINPFPGGWSDPNNAPDLTWRQHHSLISNQLRMCYHLYASAAKQGIDRFKLSQTRAILENSNFEPSSYSYEEALRSKPYNPPDSWDQACPETPTACASPGETRPLNAAELVSIIGSTQRCPYEQQLDIFPQNGHPTYPANIRICNKPESLCFHNDYTPDYKGVLHFVTGTQPSGAGAVFPSAYVPSILSPGLFPIVDDNGPLYFDGSNYSGRDSVQSALLIITHRPIPDDNALITAIRTMVTNELSGRPITIVYFPTTGLDSQPEAINRFIRAFGMDVERENILHVFSPYHRRYHPVPPTATNPEMFPTADPAWKNFREYWRYMLTNNDQDLHDGENIVKAAESIFLRRILRYVLRL